MIVRRMFERRKEKKKKQKQKQKIIEREKMNNNIKKRVMKRSTCEGCE